VARVVRPQVPEVGAGRAEGGGRGGDEVGKEAATGTEVAEEAEQRCRAPAADLAEPAAEASAGYEAAPALTCTARGVVRRDAEEDLLHELDHQRRRRRHVAGRGGTGDGERGNGERSDQPRNLGISSI
jgi:hypothetical protein